MNQVTTAARRRLRQAAWLSPLQLVFRLGEALLPLLLSRRFGGSRDMDTFTLAWTLCWFFAAGVFSLYRDSSLIPSLVGAAEAKVDLPSLRGSFVRQGVRIGVALAIVFALTTQAIPGIYGSSELAIPWQLSLSLSVYIAALCVRTMVGGLLQAEGRFVAVSAFGGASMLLVVLIIVWIRPGLFAVGWLIGGGELLAVALSVIFTFKVAPVSFGRNAEAVTVAKAFWRKGGPESLGRLIARANPMVDQLMVGNIAGGITLLRLGSDLSGVGAQILQLTVLPLLLTHLSWRFADKNFALHKRETALTCVVAGIAVAVFSGAAWVARTWLVQKVFTGSAMTSADVHRLASILGYQLLGTPFMAMQLVLSRALTSAGQGAFLFPLGIFNIVANFTMNLLLLPVMGLSGAALSTSIVVAAVFVLLALRMMGVWKAGNLGAQATASAPAGTV